MIKEFHTSDLLLACVCDQETEKTIRLVPIKNYDLKYEGIIGGIKEAIHYLKANRSPKILIIDISQSDLPINDVSKLSEVCEPGVAVIAIGTRNDVGIFRELVKLGIRDYLVKPLTTSHFVKSIENILSQNKGTNTAHTFSKFGKVVSFIGTRGGIGVTTLAVNCAWLLAERHSRRISLVDPDLQLGTIAQFLDLDASSGLQEILESPERIDETLVDRFMIKYSPHLMVMYGQSTLEEEQHIDPLSFDPIIQSMVNNFHYTIFDLPHCFSNGLNIHILENSSIIVLVTDLSIIGVKDSHRYLEIFKRHRTTDQQILLTVNRQAEYRAGEIKLEDFENAVKHKVDITIPFDSHQPLQALTKGVPLASQADASFLHHLEALTNKIMGRGSPATTPIKKLFNLFSLKK